MQSNFYFIDNFSNIFIDDSSKGYSRMIYAKSGKILSDNKDKKFVLFNGKVINIDKTRIFFIKSLVIVMLSFIEIL